jgi:site-specific recombinase XerD
MFYPEDGRMLSGLTSHQARGCAVAALQGLFMLTGAASANPDSTPLCYDNASGQYLTQEVMLKYCHQMEPLFNLPKGTVVTHSLKHAGISLLVESGLSDEEVRLAAGFASVETVKIYHHAGKKMSLRLSKAALLDASDSSESGEEEVEEEYRE